ncbi:alkaline phosphatase D family protein [Crocinitomix catalasitica]|uniref:alkaline phosphatase D family protein n=1 Tax=Crocinitomix catalasitica TaxID=184607 RepID=UPI0005612DF9|nr:alkaline phosphatase D family protein [Crocinitomix catalasitica]
MREIIKTILLAILFVQVNISFAQLSFTHGPGEEIEPEYFNPELAPFYHGVASGDPLQDRVIIWTRVTPVSDTIVPVKWVMAKDTAFTYIVAEGELTTDYTKDYTVKVDVTDLEPNVTYYYYFTALEKNSIVGRTHTLQGATASHLRFAVGSCSNYQMGYFNSYKQISKHNDLDAVLHLGDYLYEYPTYDYGYSVEVDRQHRPNDEIISLDDYRIRHSFYKLDQDLMAAHQQHPFICVWDDHEIANNTYETGAANHSEETEGDFITRKESAIRAYMEWMPIRMPEYVGGKPQIYRSFEIGDLADIIMVDTRVEDRDKQAYSAIDPLFADTTREILGEEQREWLFDKIDASNATWKIYGNQVMMSEEGEDSPDVDAWTGYPFEREKVIDKLIDTGDKNHVVLTGDTHRSWAFDLTKHPFDTAYYQPLTGRGTYGVELAAPSLASPNRNESSPGTSPLPFQAELLVENPHLRYSDLDNHGYFIMDITQLKVQADYHYVDTKFRSDRDSIAQGWFTLKDQGFLQQALSPSIGKNLQAIPAPINPRVYVEEEDHTGVINENNNLFISGVYPNPTSDYLTIGMSLNQVENVSIQLLDFTGKVCHELSIEMMPGNQKLTVDLPAGLATGIYHLNIHTDNNLRPISKRISILK